MDGREFLVVARDSAQRGSEAYWRMAASRAYYAVMLTVDTEFRRWGLLPPGRASVHQVIKRRIYASADTDMKQIGQWYDRLRALRQIADYEMGNVPEFQNHGRTTAAVRLATDALALFDGIVADAQRTASIAAEIRAVIP